MKPFNNSIATNKLRQETSVTSAGQAYPASLHRKKKEINPFAEDEMSGYKELKGFRAGHTKDTGGFQYKDLWDVNEENEKEEKKKVTLKRDINYNKIGKVVDVTEDGKYYTLKFPNGKTAIYHESDVTKPAGVTDFEKKPTLQIDEEDIHEAYVPDNIRDFAKRKGITSVVNQVARWAEKAGKKIVGGVSIGKNHNALILDLTREGGEVYINVDDKTIKAKDRQAWEYARVSNYESFLKALGLDKSDEEVMEKGSDYTITKKDSKPVIGTFDGYRRDDALLFRINGALVAIDEKDIENLKKLNENYHRFKKETVTRSKEQQMHEAMKLVRKKLYEADKVMTYVKTMKEELGLQEYKSHTGKLMERLQVSIAEIYKKYKEIK